MEVRVKDGVATINMPVRLVLLMAKGMMISTGLPEVMAGMVLAMLVSDDRSDTTERLMKHKASAIEKGCKPDIAELCFDPLLAIMAIPTKERIDLLAQSVKESGQYEEESALIQMLRRGMQP